VTIWICEGVNGAYAELEPECSDFFIECTLDVLLEDIIPKIELK